MNIETWDNRSVAMSIKLAREVLPCGQNASPVELATFLCWCQANRLDPIRKQAHLVKYKAGEPAAFVVSYWVFMERAQRHPEFGGVKQGIIWEVGGKRQRGGAAEFTPDKDHKIVGSWAQVTRKDCPEPFDVEVPWDEMAQKKRDGSLNRNWARQPTTMAVKVALSRALRLAFSEEFGDQYTDAELPGREEVSPDDRAARLMQSLGKGKTVVDVNPEPEGGDPMDDLPEESGAADPAYPQEADAGEDTTSEADEDVDAPPWDTPG